MSFEMPQPSRDHERLHRLAGLWRGSEHMHPSQWEPNGGTAEGQHRMRVGPGGFYVIDDYEQVRDGKMTFAGHAVYSWDPARTEVVLCWWDSMGQGREEFRGGWQGDTLTLTSNNTMGIARLSYDYGKPGEMKAAMDTSTDGKAWMRMFEAVYRRAD